MSNTYGLDQFSLGQVANSGVNISSPDTSLAAYPTYPNAAGVGSQSAGSNATASQPSQTSQTVGQAEQAPTPNIQPYGFNPWSMVGEANTR